MRPRKNQVLVLKSVKMKDPSKDRDLVLLVKEDCWESFKSCTSFVKRVQMASKIMDAEGKELKNEYKGNTNVSFQVEDAVI
jgi:NAD-specific glutamate dehydrogenase